MKIKFVIVGGGVAGLSASIRLAELGETPLLIEGGSYPAHKVCGEFLSPECLKILSQWDIYPVLIPQMTLNTPFERFNFIFPSSAGGLSHLQLDPALVKKASQYNVEILNHTKVLSFEPKRSLNENHLIKLSNGETIEAEQVIIATGRIPGYSIAPPVISYVGFKAHFKNIESNGNLEMFSLPHAYLGIAPIENSLYNIACLADLKEVSKHATPITFIGKLIASHPYLVKNVTKENCLFDDWMIANIPEFGIKQTPNWLDVYFIGDAAFTIPPACGNGLALAILSGRMSAEYALVKEAKKFKSDWEMRCRSQFFWAKILHKIMLKPSLSNFLIKWVNAIPFLGKKAYSWTRQSTVNF